MPNSAKMRLYTIAIIAKILLIACVATSLGQNSRSGELSEIKSKIDQLEKKLASQNQKEAETLEILDTIDRKMSVTKDYVTTLRREISSQERKVARLKTRLDTLSQNMIDLKAGFSERLVSLYKYGRVTTLELLLDASSLQQVQVWAEYQRRLSENDQRKIAAIQAEQEQLLNTQTQIAREIQREQQLLKEKNQEESELVADRKARKTLLTTIRQDKKVYQQQLRDYQKAIDEIQRLIAASESEIATAPAGEAADFVSGASFASQKGRLPWPAKGSIHRPYGPYQHPVLKTITDNLGLDIKVEAGASVHSVADGKVTAVTWQRGRGNLIIINHSDGYYTVYTHLDEILVNLQQTVAAGQIVGTVGDTGSLEGPLLHFQIWNKFDHLNPTTWLK